MSRLLLCISVLVSVGCADGDAVSGPSSRPPEIEARSFRLQEVAGSSQSRRRYRVVLDLTDKVAAIQGAVSGNAMAVCSVSRERNSASSASWVLNDRTPGSAKFAAFAPESFDVSEVLTLECNTAGLRRGDILEAALEVAGTETGEALDREALPKSRFTWTGQEWIVE